MVIAPDGMVKPGDAQLYRMSQTLWRRRQGRRPRPDYQHRFQEKSIYFEINGGPKRKPSGTSILRFPAWAAAPAESIPIRPSYGRSRNARIQETCSGNDGRGIEADANSGAGLFVKTAAEVFVDTLPPKIREAVKRHEVLVGMNHDMVVMAKDRPPQKVREKDDKGKEYENGFTGAPPQDVVFVRFAGDEVVQVKIAKVGGQITVKTEKKLTYKMACPRWRALKSSNSPQDVSGAPEPTQPAHRPH